MLRNLILAACGSRLVALVLTIPVILSPVPSAQAAPEAQISSHRYIVFLGGINSCSVSCDPGATDVISSLSMIRTNLGNLQGERPNFIYFSYSAVEHATFLCGWNSCNYRFAPNYDKDDTHLPIAQQAQALRSLLKQIVADDPNPEQVKIDLVGYSLGGLVASYWGAAYGGEAGIYEHVHSLVLLESPVGGSASAGLLLDECPLSTLPLCPVLQTELVPLFGRDVLGALRLDGSQSLVRAFPLAARVSDVTSIQSTDDYLVNNTPLAICVTTLSLTIGKGSQDWYLAGVSTTQLDKTALGQNTGAMGLRSCVNLTEAKSVVLANHGAPLRDPQTSDWVKGALNKDGSIWLGKQPRNTTVPATLLGSVDLQGRGTPPNALWQVPLVVKVLQRGTENAVGTFNATTDSSGNFTVRNLPPGTWDIDVKHAQTLSRRATSVAFTQGRGVTIKFGTLLAGDANNDNVVNSFDYSILVATFGRSAGQAGYDGRADLNGDNAINTFDRSLMLANFDQRGPVPASSSSSTGLNTGVFLPTGRMVTPRTDHTATLLMNGKVLVTGGQFGRPLSSAEIYDPSSGVFATTGTMSTGRIFHTATLLPSGKVLVTGGMNLGGPPLFIPVSLSSAEVYDPATGNFSATGSMAGTRAGHTATILPDGHVLIAGGVQTSSAELYDPSTGTFSPTSRMSTIRGSATATRLPNGKVLFAGGTPGVGCDPCTPISAEIYDPSTGTFSPTGNMITPRGGHTATVLTNGKVLISGGQPAFFTGGSPALSTAELYDPVTGTFSSLGQMIEARWFHTSALLPDGRVLLAGGFGNGTCCLSSAELFDPASGTFSPGSAMATGHLGTATLLPNGKVLVASRGAPDDYLSAELFLP